ncbi:MAG: ion transporter [Roseibium sp.]|nr:ion transporter [Roseibium sp.]MBO6894282.1 ion transporter [Roseibium sp.]MBO6929523.1 ion transporter [Roseibium sp.]
MLEPTAWPRPGLSPVNRGISVVILAATATAVIESEPTILDGREWAFRAVELFFTSIFVLEYVARIWVAGEDPRYQGAVGRMKYAFTPAAIIDLLSVSPLLLTFLGTEAFLLRLFRLLRILRVARLGRFSRAFEAISTALHSRRYELLMSVGLAAMLLLISSTILYMIEGNAQPDAFGSIPRTMWWSIATLTTVGYGDVYPTTSLGQFFAGLTAITGIGLIAMPTGILAAAFSDAIQMQRTANSSETISSEDT